MVCRLVKNRYRIADKTVYCFQEVRIINRKKDEWVWVLRRVDWKHHVVRVGLEGTSRHPTCPEAGIFSRISGNTWSQGNSQIIRSIYLIVRWPPCFNCSAICNVHFVDSACFREVIGRFRFRRFTKTRTCPWAWLLRICCQGTRANGRGTRRRAWRAVPWIWSRRRRW